MLRDQSANPHSARARTAAEKDSCLLVRGKKAMATPRTTVAAPATKGLRPRRGRHSATAALSAYMAPAA